MVKRDLIFFSIGFVASIVGVIAYTKYKSKHLISNAQEEPQVGVSQGEPISDKASLFNLFTRTRYTNPTNTPKPRPQTLSQKQIWQLNQPKVPKFAQTPGSQTPKSVRGDKTGVAQQQTNVNIKQWL